MFKRALEDPKQVLLFATSIDDAIACDSDVRVLSEVMDHLDWSGLEAAYSSIGCPAYSPVMLTKVLVYAYSKGVRSSRKIEELVENDKRYIWLAGGLKPDHNTIARFRKTKYEYLRELFSQSVRLCAEAGLVLLNVVSIDSTKIAARASKRSLYDEGQVCREMAAIDRILAEAEEADDAEDEEHGDGNGRQIPEHLRDAVKRRAKLAEIAKRLKEERACKISSSDPESRVMKVSGRLRPGYSLQVAVDSAKQVIVAMELTQRANDAGSLPDTISELESNVGMCADVVVADRGYSDEGTFTWLDDAGQDALVVPKEHPIRRSNDLFSSGCFLPADGADELICPAGRRLTFAGEYRTGSGVYRQYGAVGCRSCSFYQQCADGKGGRRRVSISSVECIRQRMRDRICSPDGKKLLSLRRETVEPVFGQAKANRSFDRFLLWGKSGAIAESVLICLVHNLLKCARSRASAALLSPVQLCADALGRPIHVFSSMAFQHCRLAAMWPAF